MSSKKTGSKLTDYEVLGIIGTGTFGTCYKVRKKSDGQFYVWKAVNYGSLGQDKKKLLVSEVNLLSQLNHPNIVRYHERIIHKPTTILYIVMEWCEGGDLASVISLCKRNGSVLKESFVWQVLYQTGRALLACHSHVTATILHRDIKPANVFLDAMANVKLGDFGLARVVTGDMYSYTRVGTPYYMSPEVVKGGKYTKSSDIWSLGCLIYELCVLHPPFEGSDFRNLAKKILEGRFARIPEYYTDNLQTFISLLLKMNPVDRPFAENILQHPFVLTQLANDSFNSILAKQKSIQGSALTEPISYVTRIPTLCTTEPMKKPNANDQTEHFCEENYQNVWLSRLDILKRKEMSLRVKELALCEREKILEKREKTAMVLNKIAEERLNRANLYLEECRDVCSVASSFCRVKSAQTEIHSDADTSLSADPGDTSILPTSAKVNPGNIPKPAVFFTGARKKHVRFGTLPGNKSKNEIDVWEEKWVEEDLFTRHKVLSTLDTNCIDTARKASREGGPKTLTSCQNMQPFGNKYQNKNITNTDDRQNKENVFHVPELLSKMSLNRGANLHTML